MTLQTPQNCLKNQPTNNQPQRFERSTSFLSSFNLSLDHNGQSIGKKENSSSNENNDTQVFSFGKACMLLMKCSIGMGLLYTPCALGRLGYFWGSLMLLVIATLCMCSLYLLSRCCIAVFSDLSDKRSSLTRDFLYGEVCKAAFGNASQMVVLVLVIVSSCNLLITFALNIGRHLSQVIFLKGTLFEHASPSLVTTCVSILIFTPICLFAQSLEWLNKMSTMEVINMSFIIVLIMVKMSVNIVSNPMEPYNVVVTIVSNSKVTWEQAMCAMTGTVLSLSSHVGLSSLLPRFVHVDSGDLALNPVTVILTSQIGAALVYLMVLLLSIVERMKSHGYVGMAINLLEYNRCCDCTDESDKIRQLWPLLYDTANIALVINFIIAYPLVLDYCRKLVCCHLKLNTLPYFSSNPSILYYGITILLLLVSTLMGALMQFKNSSSLCSSMTLIAIICGSCLCYIFPSAIYLKLTSIQDFKSALTFGLDYKGTRLSSVNLERMMSWVVLLFGLGFLISGSATNIKKILSYDYLKVKS